MVFYLKRCNRLHFEYKPLPDCTWIPRRSRNREKTLLLLLNVNHCQTIDFVAFEFPDDHEKTVTIHWENLNENQKVDDQN